jgi:hypothetical protein
MKGAKRMIFYIPDAQKLPFEQLWETRQQLEDPNNQFIHGIWIESHGNDFILDDPKEIAAYMESDSKIADLIASEKKFFSFYHQIEDLRPNRRIENKYEAIWTVA